jgi:hypothetical protein
MTAFFLPLPSLQNSTLCTKGETPSRNLLCGQCRPHWASDHGRPIHKSSKQRCREVDRFLTDYSCQKKSHLGTDNSWARADDGLAGFMRIRGLESSIATIPRPRKLPPAHIHAGSQVCSASASPKTQLTDPSLVYCVVWILGPGTLTADPGWQCGLLAFTTDVRPLTFPYLSTPLTRQ